MTVGVVIGKFYPLHKGHIYMIEEASKKVDKLYVLPAFTDGQTIPISTRENWIKDWVDNHYNGNTKIVVDKVLEQLGDSEDGKTSDYGVSKVWARYLKDRFPDITHFIGSEPYIKMMADWEGMDYFIIDVDRLKVPISATQIRENFNDNKHMLATDKVRDEYVKRVVLIGIESSGKTTIGSELARRLDAEFVEEYGRTYCEINSPLDDGKDYFLTRRDFHNIAIGHNRLMLRAYEKALTKGRKLVVADAEHITTQCFFKRYLGEEDKRIAKMIHSQEYDLYIWLPPLSLELDGTRREISEEERSEQEKEVMEQFKHLPVVIAYGNTIDERVNCAIERMKDKGII